MLCGFPPFHEESNQLLFEKIENCEFSFPEEYWGNISDCAKDLIVKLLVRKPQERLNAE
jgi:serine/threonine protein kinase